MTDALTKVRERGAMDCADTDCTYCRQETGDCRPTPVVGRDYVPRLCNDCYGKLSDVGRLDWDRDKELFFP